jgi:4-alpha-glucanotransferase
MNPSGWLQPSYLDAFGRERRIAPDVLRRLEQLVGDEPPAGDLDAVAVLRPGEPLPTPGDLVLEDGTQLGPSSALPSDVPFGYHRLRAGNAEQRLLVGPGRCHPPGARSWGWAVQLYAARSAESWGIGDLADLRRLAAWSHGLGAGLLVVNPLNAATPVVPVQPSPYFPSTRRFRDPLYLRVEEVPGADAVADLPRLAAAGRALNGGARIDRDAILTLKLDALRAIWDAAPPAEGLDAYRAEMGPALREWAVFAALAERHGAGWSHWPEELRRPASAAVARFAADHARRIAFHEWVQWLLDEQLRGAAVELSLVADVPVGVDRDGADAWAWQEVLALGASFGAPPDRFNAAGQDWGLPPFAPGRLRAAGYEPFIQTLRAAARHAGGLRIDHAMGLFRLWWMALGDHPRDGAYVRYPSDELFAILAIESARAGAVVIGEDLGTVAPGVRGELRRRGLLSYRLAYFERRRPARYPRASLAAVGTHDLPTVAGTWLGSDLDLQRRAGLEPDAAGLALLRSRLARAAGVSPSADVGEVILAGHRALAASPAAIVVATLDDALRVEERPNLPGTVDEHPNWRIPLPVSIERMADDPFVARLAAALDREPLSAPGAGSARRAEGG